jgi:protoheme IX farnesyltransferase
VRGRAVAYAKLTKPRIVVLLLVTTVPAMVLAEGGLPSLGLVAATLLGGVMTAGSANAFNQYLERDIDARMHRTRARPLPAHTVAPTGALVFAVVLGLAGFAWLTVVVNLLSALLAASAIVFYVLVYTVWLKRSTPQNIVIGGAAGAVPVLVGWSAVTGRLDWAPVVLFGLIFIWTPPHFWALAIKYRDDYAAASVPMLPSVRDAHDVAVRIVAYTVALWGLSMVFAPVADMGGLYVGSAITLGAVFTWFAARLLGDSSPKAAMRLFGWSITYITLLFGAMAADQLVRTGV